MSKYTQRGVSADKEDVHNAIKHFDKGLYPTAFCKILPDLVGGDERFCNIMHSDTAGTKTALAYMYWKQTGDNSVWKGVVQDAIVMNTDDMACVGCTDNIILSSTIGRNKALIDGNSLKHLIDATPEFIKTMAQYGVSLTLAGGETADVGDIVRTVDVGFTAFARMKRSDLIINSIRPGQVIVGFSSYGQSNYENTYNSGIGSNGLTMARHELFHSIYANYTETFAPQIDEDLVYTGQYNLDDSIAIGDEEVHIGKLALSPTRTYLPVIKKILDAHRPNIYGMIHNTGGAHSKVLNYCDVPVKIVKNHLLPVPPIFSIIQEMASLEYEEMFKVFNMGTRLEIYTSKDAAIDMIQIAESFGIDAGVIGFTDHSETGQSQVRIEYKGKQIKY